MSKNQFRQIKNNAWKFYDKWRKKPSYSPAFKAKIVVSLKGWKHIVGGGKNTKRSPADVMRRFYLLPKAKEITEKLAMVQGIEKRYGRTFYALEAMVEIEERGKKDLRKVRVLFVEGKKKEKIFFSVMDSKLKKYIK